MGFKDLWTCFYLHDFHKEITAEVQKKNRNHPLNQIIQVTITYKGAHNRHPDQCQQAFASLHMRERQRERE